MTKLALPVTLLAALIACNIAGIEDEATFGPVEQVKDGFTSASFAVTDQGQVILFDTGSNKKAKNILDALEARSLSADDVTHLFLTHGHTDHTRGLEFFPKATVYAMESELPIIEEEGPENAEVDQFVSDGEVLTIDDQTVEVFGVPGHTPGSAIYLIGGTLIIGDTAIVRGDGSIGMVPKSFSEDPEEAAASFATFRDRIAERPDDVKAAVFSHSGGINSVQPILDYTVE